MVTARRIHFRLLSPAHAKELYVFMMWTLGSHNCSLASWQTAGNDMLLPCDCL